MSKLANKVVEICSASLKRLKWLMSILLT